MNLSVTGWIPPQEKQAGNGEEPKRERGQLEGNRTQPLWILPVCRCCSKTKQWPSLCVSCRDRKPVAFLFGLRRICLKTFPEYTGRRRRETRNDTKGEEKREISHDFFFSGRVSQAVSLSAMKPVTQPANKPTGPFHSAGPLARDQLMPPNKELLSCITSPQRGHAGFSFLSPGSARLPHKASASPASFLPSPIISPLCSGRIRVFLGPQKRPQKHHK